MRTLLLLWAAPVAAFWTWHLMSVGGIVFPLAFHDEVFALYGRMLGIDPAAIPGLLTRAFLLDGSILLAVLAYRRRRPIAVFVRARTGAFEA